MELPKRHIPYTETELPNRMNARRLRLLPRCTKSRMLTDEPSLDIP
jgi:hypothetical protein